MSVPPQKESQTVTPAGESVAPLIDGVRCPPRRHHSRRARDAVRNIQSRVEFSAAPLVYVYQITIRPGRIKAWAMHKEQDDRLFIGRGAVRIALYDDRADSPTHKMINTLFVDEHNRSLVLIPHEASIMPSKTWVIPMFTWSTCPPEPTTTPIPTNIVCRSTTI